VSRREDGYAALEQRDLTEAVPCPLATCRAKPRERCWNWITGGPLLVSHWQRVRDARSADPQHLGNAVIHDAPATEGRDR
jgi:hypothetical protein